MVTSTLAIICDRRPRNALAGAFMFIQFRIDVLHAISLEIQTSFRETALQEHEGFSHAYITKITGRCPYLVSGNRAGTYKEPEDLFRFLLASMMDGNVSTGKTDRFVRCIHRVGLIEVRQKPSKILPTTPEKYTFCIPLGAALPRGKWFDSHE